MWEYDSRRDTLKLVYQSLRADDLQAPDDLVYVPQTGVVLLQADGPGEQFVRGVTQEGQVYDFAQSLLSDSEFCGGCFSPDGQTFFPNQQGGGPAQPAAGAARPDAVDREGGLTYAIWGPFRQRNKKAHAAGRKHGGGR